jgi:hypothetical protein
MATQQSEAATRHRWAAAQIAALVVGVAFLLPGVLGFVPGITTHYEMLDFAGHESWAKLLGISAFRFCTTSCTWRSASPG